MLPCRTQTEPKPHADPSVSRATTEDEEAPCQGPPFAVNGEEALSRADLEHVHRFIGRPRAKVHTH